MINIEWQGACDFVSPQDEPVIRGFLQQVITKFSKLAREERGK